MVVLHLRVRGGEKIIREHIGRRCNLRQRYEVAVTWEVLKRAIRIEDVKSPRYLRVIRPSCGAGRLRPRGIHTTPDRDGHFCRSTSFRRRGAKCLHPLARILCRSVTEHQKPTKVLITGGYGFIGSNLVHRCLAEGAHVRVLDNQVPGTGTNPANLNTVIKDVEFFSGDVANEELTSTAAKGVDVVFHCAAFTSHTGATEDPKRAIRTNYLGTLGLLEGLRSSDIQAKLVHVGTTTQLGPLRHEPADEDHPEYPLDVYSATMVASEKLILAYTHAHGLRASVIRLSNTYGPRAAIHDPNLGFVNYFIGLGLQKKQITVYGDGRSLRSVLYIDDAVEALYRAAVNERSIGEVLFAASGRPHKIAHIAEAITRHIGGEVDYVPWPDERRAIDVGDAVIDTARIAKRLDWAAQTELDDGLTKTADFYASRLDSYLVPAADVGAGTS